MTIYAGSRPTGNLINDGLIMSIDMANSFSYRSGVSTLTAKDVSTRGANGLMSSSNYTTEAGGALTFGAKTDGCTGVTGSVTVGSSFSMGIWLYPTANGSTGPIFILSSSINVGGANAAGLVYQGSSAPAQAAATMRTTGTPPEIGANNSWIVNNYQYYMMTYNGTTLTFYRNGSSVGTNTTGGTYALANIPNDYLIGANVAQGNATFFRMHMAHIYNRTLSAAEVLANYNATRARFGL